MTRHERKEISSTGAVFLTYRPAPAVSRRSGPVTRGGSLLNQRTPRECGPPGGGPHHVSMEAPVDLPAQRRINSKEPV